MEPPMPAARFTVAALDLDDTLLRSDGTISAHTLAVLRRWLKTGRRLVIATGRPRRSVPAVLPPELHDTPLVCYNGAEIHIDGDCIYENLIAPEAVHAIVQQVQRAAPEATVGLEVGGELYLDRAMERRSAYQVADLFTLTHHPAAKVLIFGAVVETLLPVLAALPATARALLSARYQFVQILAATADKAVALRVLMAQWGVPLDQVVAFGDDTNDVEMLRECGLGVAVANAVDEVKAVADEVTATNDEDGVAQVLERLLAA
jgi:Cof subfamily protein (haloacid dehalogenase superfamily)